MVKTSLTNYLAAAGLALLAGGTYWLLQITLPPGNVAPARPPAHTADYFADDSSISVLDNTGSTAYRLNSRKLVHYEDDQTSDVTEPALRAFQPGNPDVSAFARRGTINADASVVDLYDQARLLRAAGPADPPMRADSSHFHVLVNDDVIETEKPVKLLRGQSVSTANGLIYNNVTRNLRLLGQVRGTIAPNAFGPQSAK
ncbi:MAG: LPS export ABC transporter periplasmic protein LptC [Janthinobacterium lividum]